MAQAVTKVKVGSCGITEARIPPLTGKLPCAVGMAKKKKKNSRHLLPISVVVSNAHCILSGIDLDD